jgi:hypothetical protein
MAANKATTADGTASMGAQTIEQLQARYAALNTKKIQSETLLKQASQQLDTLQREARERYGTDDLKALQTKLQEMKNENERKRAEYQAALERIEGELEQVEQNYQATAGATKEGP